jgi:hypothetical protein
LHDDETIVVYQAYKPGIARAICKHKTFHNDEGLKAGFNLNRMTWIKTNFLWMMFRCGWATKPSQERVLAFRIKRTGFDELLSRAVLSSSSSTSSTTINETNIKNASVVLQWDPDHLPSGEKVSTGRRAIQLGLRGDMLEKFSKHFILDATDITDFVHKQHVNCLQDESGQIFKEDLSKLEMPIENIYLPGNVEEVANRIKLDLI